MLESIFFVQEVFVFFVHELWIAIIDTPHSNRYHCTGVQFLFSPLIELLRLL